MLEVSPRYGTGTGRPYKPLVNSKWRSYEKQQLDGRPTSEERWRRTAIAQAQRKKVKESLEDLMRGDRAYQLQKAVQAHLAAQAVKITKEEIEI
jgi:hypothetical protein